MLRQRHSLNIQKFPKIDIGKQVEIVLVNASVVLSLRRRLGWGENVAVGF